MPEKPLAHDTRRSRLIIPALALLLLVVGLSRMVRISEFDLDQHENYAISQAHGTVEEIMRWTPYDWGAGSFLVLGGWQALVGSDPIMLRYLSVLLFVFGSACVYAVTRSIVGRQAAPLAVLVYAAPIALILLSLFTRGYAILIALLPCSLLIAERYTRRPSLVNGAVLAVSLAAMVYVHITGLFALLMIGLFMVARGGIPTLRRWIVMAVVTSALIAPMLFSSTNAAIARFSSFSFGLSGSQLQELLDFVIGTPALGALWALLTVAGVVGLARGRAPGALWLLLAWSVLGLILVYVLGGLIGSPRHSWWYLLPAAMWIAGGIARLPRPAAVGAGMLALAIAFAPVPRLNWLDDSAFPNPPLFDNFRWLAQHARWGDVVLVDPNAVCAPYTDEWDNAVRTFFPNGLRFVTDPTGYARVWYVTSNGWDNPDVHQAVQANRLASIFVGPPECLFRLYAGAPDAAGVPFENGLRFHGAELLKDDSVMFSPLVLHKAEPLHIRLWWSVDRPLEADYSIAVHLYLEDGTLIAQDDGAPRLVSLSLVDPPPQVEMIAWEPGQIYAEERTIEIPSLTRTATGVNRLDAMLIVYQWWDGARIAAPGIDAETRLPLVSVDVRSF